MSPDVEAPVMFPSEGSHQHGPPSLGRVRELPRSPTSPLLCSPPTPSSPSATAPVSPCWPPTTVRVLVQVRQRLHPQTRCPPETGHRVSVAPGSTEERCGPPRLLGRPLPACRGRTPRRERPSPRPTSSVRPPSPSREPTLWAPGMCSFRGCMSHGPHARVPTHRRPRHRDRRKAHYRPGRAHPWSGGARTRWTTYEVS